MVVPYQSTRLEPLLEQGVPLFLKMWNQEKRYWKQRSILKKLTVSDLYYKKPRKTRRVFREKKMS